MKHFKNHNPSSGFSFVEVALAVLVLGIMLTAALALQNSSFTSILKYSEKFTRVVLLKELLFDAAVARAQNKPYEHQEKKVTEPIETTLKYSIAPVHKNSSLKNFSTILVEKAEASWAGITQKNKETMISFIYKPEKNEKEKK